MKYVKVIDGVVVQKQPYAEEGFIEAPDDVVPGFLYDGTNFTAPVIPGPTVEEQNAEIEKQRYAAFKMEADPLFFKEQRGEVEAGTWLAKVTEIRERLPYK